MMVETVSDTGPWSKHGNNLAFMKALLEIGNSGCSTTQEGDPLRKILEEIYLSAGRQISTDLLSYLYTECKHNSSALIELYLIKIYHTVSFLLLFIFNTLVIYF